MDRELDFRPGGQRFNSAQATRWQDTNLTLLRHRYGINREPDVKFKLDFFIIS
jgi:hypothetical protein